MQDARAPVWRIAVITGSPSVTGVNQDDGPTPIRGIRISDDLWAAAKRAAADNGESVTAVIRRALERYVAQHPLGD